MSVRMSASKSQNTERPVNSQFSVETHPTQITITLTAKKPAIRLQIIIMTLRIRWYYWFIGIGTLILIVLGSAIALEEVAYRATEKQQFVTTCTIQSVSGASARHCECIWRQLRRNHSVPTLSDFVRGAYIPADIFRDITRERDQAFLNCR